MSDRRKTYPKGIFNPVLAWIFCLFFTVLLVLGLLNYLSIEKIYSSSRLEEIKLFTHGLKAPLREMVRAKDYAEIELTLQKSFLNKDLDILIMSDPEGKKVLSLKRGDSPDHIETFYDINPLPLPDAVYGKNIKIEIDNKLKVWQPLSDTESLGWLYLELNNDHVRLVINRLRRNVLIVVGIILIILIISFYYFRHNTNKRLFIHDYEIVKEKDYWNNKALQDSLTKLPNRHSLLNIVQLAINASDDNRQLLGIIFIDLDGFKDINDQYGHQMGDLLLQQVAQTLTKIFRSDDKVFRYGGDEFVIVCERLENKEELEFLIERVFEDINIAYNLADEFINISFSMGVTIYPKDGASNPSELVAHADEAMYEAKKLGKNRYCYY